MSFYGVNDVNLHSYAALIDTAMLVAVISSESVWVRKFTTRSFAYRRRVVSETMKN